MPCEFIKDDDYDLRYEVQEKITDHWYKPDRVGMFHDLIGCTVKF